MSKKNDEDFGDVFKQAMAGVQPLKKQPRHVQLTSLTKLDNDTYKTRRAAAAAENSGAKAGLSDAHIDPVEREQILSFSRAGLQRSRMRQFRTGAIPIVSQLDLHGCTIDEAREQVVTFLGRCQHERLTCVLIIHGKAYKNENRQGTLKSHVNHWLRQLPVVLAFCSAPQHQGGGGALLVLLKKSSELKQ